MNKIDSELCRTLDIVLESDFLGRAQILTYGQAESRLVNALKKRDAALAGNADEWEREYWRDFGYRSIAYDAAGLTAAMLREFPDSDYEIVGAHMQLMRSMLMNEPTPAVFPLLRVGWFLRAMAGQVAHKQERLDAFQRVSGVRPPQGGDGRRWEDRAVWHGLYLMPDEAVNDLLSLPGDDVWDHFASWVREHG